MRIGHSIGIGHDGDGYAPPRVAAANTGDFQSSMRSHAVKAAAPAGPTFEPRSPRTDDRLMSADARPAGFGRACGPRSSWLEDALQTLADIDEEIAEDGLPEVSLPTKREAERIVGALATHPWAPAVYPTQAGEIAIQFRSPDSPGSVVILLDGRGRAECYAYTGGRSRRAHYDVSSDLPDGFVTEQLRAMIPARMAAATGFGGLGTSAMVLLAGFPTAL